MDNCCACNERTSIGFEQWEKVCLLELGSNAGMNENCAFVLEKGSERFSESLR